MLIIISRVFRLNHTSLLRENVAAPALITGLYRLAVFLIADNIPEILRDLIFQLSRFYETVIVSSRSDV